MIGFGHREINHISQGEQQNLYFSDNRATSSRQVVEAIFEKHKLNLSQTCQVFCLQYIPAFVSHLRNPVPTIFVHHSFHALKHPV